jgi:hypothetical protein
MNSKHTKNCEELRLRFESREAIYVEQGALRVRVKNIQARGFRISAEAEEIVTQGLGVGRFDGPCGRHTPPRRWKFIAGYLTSFSAQSWQMGYGGWSLYFAPRIVQGVIDFAVQLPRDRDAHDAYRQLCSLLRDLSPHESSQLVFPDVVEHGSGEFRRSEFPAIAVKVSSGWVTCPFCEKRFMPSDARRWDGESHVTCGQRILLNAA